ncbi:gas vesicle protein GvpJ [Streptomyces sp. NPDC060209]|uniref:gas vesicle protein n=1 Tax=Streptomyces sp. NPDC060209 TaxID=3347073 RepID=UPI00366462F8
MTDSLAGRMGASSAASPYGQQQSSANLADILERVLDKGVVIAGDIQINLLDIELLTIKLRLLVASVDKAKEMGIDWWEHDPSLSSRARPGQSSQVRGAQDDSAVDQVEAENARLRAEIAELRAAVGLPGASAAGAGQDALPGRTEAENTEGEESK